MIILWLGLKVFSQLSPQNLDRETKYPALFFLLFFMEKSYTHMFVFLLYVFMLYKCTCMCKSSWQKEREWERAKCQCLSFSIYSTACLFFISVIRPGFILRSLCCHCCKLYDPWPLVLSYCLLLTNYNCLPINKLQKKGVQQTTFGDKSEVPSILLDNIAPF